MKSAKQQIIDTIFNYLKRAGVDSSIIVEDPQTPNLQLSFDTYVERFEKFRSELTFQVLYEEIKKAYPLPI